MKNGQKRFLLCLMGVSHLLFAGEPVFFGDRSISQSIAIVRLSDGKMLFEDSPQLPLIPASVTKLFTSAAVLHYFGSDRTFKTKIYRTGPVVRGVVQGDLVFVGAGDPMFVSENLWQIAADLSNMGITGVRGNLILDNSLFPRSFWDKDRISGQDATDHAYQAPISAFAVNFNTFAMSVSPAEKVGQRALVRFDPYHLAGVVIRNNTRTVSPQFPPQISVVRRLIKGREYIDVKGNLPVEHKMLKFHRAIGDVVQTNGRIVLSFLKNAGIIVKGQIESATLNPEKSQLLLEHESKTVAEMIKGLNYYSNNYIADVLLAKLGVENGGSGIQALHQFLSRTVGVKDSISLMDGSGLNPENRVSASQIVDLLRYMHTQPKIFYEYLISLPKAAESGSLEKRFVQTEENFLKGVIRAKTGTLTQPLAVSSLAGYLSHSTHGLCAFAILQNGKQGKKQPSVAGLRDNQETELAKVFMHLQNVL